MNIHRKASFATKGIAMAGIAIGLALPAVADASLLAAAGVCTLTGSDGQIVGNTCVRGDDPGQGAPASIPGGSGRGSGAGVAFGGSAAGVYQDYGVFHGYAAAAGHGLAAVGESGGVNASARGIMRDLLTLGGGSGFGHLTLEWTISGTTALGGYRGASANMQMDVQTATTGNRQGSGNLFIQNAGVYSIANLPFFFGQPIDLTVSSDVVASSGYDEGGGPYAFYAAAHFENTSILTGVFAYDTSGRLIDGITMTSASGTRYPVAAEVPGDPPTQAVPEPASSALLVA
ncbi:MAG: hypothetical protein ABI277_10010, partial [Burkholderiaceae bacterium]